MTKPCEWCGNIMQPHPKSATRRHAENPAAFQRRRFCSKACGNAWSQAQPKPRLPRVKCRYRNVKIGGVTISEHRHVMSQIVGRPLEPTEYVHHKNLDTQDNKPENLELMSPQAHSIEHNQKHPLSKSCVICGAIFTPHKTKRARQQTCGRECMRRLISLRRRARGAA